MSVVIFFLAERIKFDDYQCLVPFYGNGGGEVVVEIFVFINYRRTRILNIANRIYRFSIILTLILSCFPSICNSLTGKVISIADGDTITILDSSNQRHKIRLYRVDTPEKSQAYGKAAKKHTSQLTYRKIANVKNV